MKRQVTRAFKRALLSVSCGQVLHDLSYILRIPHVAKALVCKPLAPVLRNPTPYTPNPTPYTLHPTPHTLDVCKPLARVRPQLLYTPTHDQSMSGLQDQLQ